jgi:hypothetical protein
MKPHRHPGAECIDRISWPVLGLQPISTFDPDREPSRSGRMVRVFIGTGAAVLFAALSGQPLSAQAWAPPNPYIQQAPYPAPGNNRPGYAAPAQQYAPPTYSQQTPYTQAYPQQPYGQQAYAPPASSYPTDDYGQGQPQVYDQAPAYGQPQGPAQALDPARLEQLVAPIALYPDTLVAQVLAAATYPAQLIAADHWRQAMGYASPDQIVAGANAQPWDPSVKSLTAFPQVLAMLDANLQWTTDLGNAYYNQPQDVLDIVQVMRQRAQAAGTLQSSPQESVSYDQGYIQLAPVNPAVAYVPAYDPWEAYGQPVTPYSGFSLSGALGSIASFAGSALVHYGPGIAMTAFNHSPFGLLSWAINWLSQAIQFNHSNYYSNSTSVAHWNLPARTPRGFAERAGVGRSGEQYNRFPRSDNWANRGYQAQQPLSRQADRFAENRPVEAPHQPFASPDRNGVRSAFDNYRSGQPMAVHPQPYTSRPMETYNRQPEPVRQNYGSGYGSGFMSRPAGGYGSRPGAGYSSPAPIYRAENTMPQRPGFGERYSEPGMNRGFSNQEFKSEKSGGFHPFGGGNKSGSAFGGKMPKEFSQARMPKEFRSEKMPKGYGKMPKAPKEHGHSGGGHGFSFGGHHH